MSEDGKMTVSTDVSPLKTMIEAGTKIWLDSVEPAQLQKNFDWGITGATSNPVIISDIIKRGHFDRQIDDLIAKGLSTEEIAWSLDDGLVRHAQELFEPVWRQTGGDDGYASFELDPLLEDAQRPIPHQQRVQRYIELGKRWSAGHKNRMIKVPATAAGIEALEELAALGLSLNVTLCFTDRQYTLARDAVWRGAQRRKDGLSNFKSVYSIFISRVDVYTDKYLPELSAAAQGLVGIVNAKRLWQKNQEFWNSKGLRLKQEIIFASTGVKKAGDPADKYIEAFAGGGILTNPPETNEAVQNLHKHYTRTIDQMPPRHVLQEIDQKVDQQKMEDKLIEEGIAKFVDPQKKLINLIDEKRNARP